MKKILQISVAEHFGGIEKLELEYTYYFRNDFKMDILALNSKTFKAYEKEYANNLYDLDIPVFTRKSEILYDYRLFKFLKKNKYDIIHINSGVFFYSFRVALISKICGVKKIILHSHSYEKGNILKSSLKFILKPLLQKLADEYLTCSKKAGESLFTKSFINNKVTVLKNGIDVEQFRFSEEKRTRLKKELNIENKIVYGHIGRLSEVKNHDFLIDIFYEIQKKQENNVLLLVGDGELKNIIKDKCSNLNLVNKVVFMGFRDDIYDILNIMDYFIFPSYAEGLGLACIEAQTNGINCFVSNRIPIEAKISDCLSFFSLDEKAEDIANCILNKSLNSSDFRKDAYKNAIKYGYEKNDCFIQLKNIYKKLLEEE